MKIISLVLILVLSISLVFALNIADNVNAPAGAKVQGNISSIAGNFSANSNASAKIRERVMGRIEKGEQVRLNGAVAEKVKNHFRLTSGNVFARTNFTINSSEDGELLVSKGNRTHRVKVMPDVAAEKALQRLKLKVCNESNNCSIELREVGEGNQTRASYKIQAKKKARIFGLFKKDMDVEAEINAETGDVIRTRKPWWAFLASE